jgi:hypothetical protein
MLEVCQVIQGTSLFQSFEKSSQFGNMTDSSQEKIQESMAFHI